MVVCKPVQAVMFGVGTCLMCTIDVRCLRYIWPFLKSYIHALR